MSVNSKMTALADEIRELSGTEEAMGLDAMKIHVGEANTEVNTQADLIAQIRSTVDSLPEAGSDDGGDPGVILDVAYAFGNDYALCRPIIFQRGATWQEFINSEYNKFPTPSVDMILENSYRAYGNYVENAQHSFQHISNDKTSSGRVKLTDVIEPGKMYQYYDDE